MSDDDENLNIMEDLSNFQRKGRQNR